MPPIESIRAEVIEINAAASAKFAEALRTTGAASDAALAESERLAAQAARLNRAILEWREGRFLKVVGDLEAVVAEERRAQSDVLGRLENLARTIRDAAGLGAAPAPQPQPPQPQPPQPAVAAQPSPTGPPVATTPQPAIVAPGGARRIVISDQDLDALARVARSEVGHFGKYGQDQLFGGLAAVVDTIINRVANPGFPGTIEAVVDQPAQFSAINPLGTWTLLDAAPPTIFNMVANHVAQRAAGKASEIGGATHFLNPHLSSRTAMESWGQFVVNNAVASFGSDADKDVHFHGTAPGTKVTPSYVLVRAGAESAFDDTGRAAGGGPSNAALRGNIVRVCTEELAFFGAGAAKETDDPHFKRVGDYWHAIGKPFDGRTVGANGKRIAWSAAFVSFVMREAGAGARFPGAASHAIYFQHFVEATGPTLYRALPATVSAPSVGDIIHHGREFAANLDFVGARLAFAADDFYPSHSAIVTAVDRSAGVVKTIGGNEDESVRERSFAVDGDGLLKPRKSGQTSLPWIGVLKLI